MLQLCLCRDTEHLGSLESTQEAGAALRCSSSNSYLFRALQTCRVLNASTYPRRRINLSIIDFATCNITFLIVISASSLLFLNVRINLQTSIKQLVDYI